MKSEKSPTKKVPKRKRILSSDSEHDDREGRKTEYERKDPDYEPGPDKYKQPKKMSRPNLSMNKPQEASKNTAKHTDTEPTAHNINRNKELQENRKSKAEILSSPKKDKDKDRSTTRIENGHGNGKQDSNKGSSHQNKSSHASIKSKDRDEKHKMREKHRSSPHKKHGSVLLGPSNAKRDSELTFKLSNATKKDSSHISAYPSTKEAVNDSSSTEAIKKMLSGEKPMQLERKSQQEHSNATYHTSKEKSISHERKNANKLFPRNPRQSSADSSEAKKNQFQTTSPGLIHRSQNIEEQTKRTTNGIEREKYIQQNNASHNSTESHNLLSCIMTEMEKKT